MKYLQLLLLSIVLAISAAKCCGQANRPMGMEARLFPMLGRLLTDEQRLSLMRNMDAQRDQIQPLQQTIRSSRAALLNQIVTGKFDEKLARQYAGQSAGAEAQLTVIFVRALSQMQPPLSAQQLAQLKNFQSGHFVGFRDEAETPAPEVHLKLPPPLPTDTNGLPVVN
jgi:Spy/CpxP family protein refolding chaperone